MVNLASSKMFEVLRLQGCGIKGFFPTSVTQGNQWGVWQALFVVSQKWVPFPTAPFGISITRAEYPTQAGGLQADRHVGDAARRGVPRGLARRAQCYPPYANFHGASLQRPHCSGSRPLVLGFVTFDESPRPLAPVKGHRDGRFSTKGPSV